MSLHGQYISDDSKWIRPEFDANENCVRILLFEDWYDRLKPLYDALKWIAAGAGLEATKNVSDYIQACFDWLEALVFEFRAWGILVTFSIISFVAAWVSDRVRLGKFTYQSVGRVGQSRVGATRAGGGVKLFELPVEG